MAPGSKPNFLASAIADHSRLRPDAIAFTDGDQIRLSSAELFHRIGNLQSQWKPVGLNDQTPVLVFLPHEISLAVCLTALLSNDVPGLSVSHRENAAEPAKLLRRFPIQALLTNPSAARRLLTSDPTLHSIFDSPVKIELPFDPEGLLIYPVKADQKQRDLDFAWALMTSGSTGHSKAVKLSWENLQARARGEISLFQISQQDRILNFLSFAHDLGFNQLLTALVTGATLEVIDPKLPADLGKYLARCHYTGTTGMPLIWSSFLQYARDAGLSELPLSGYLTISGGTLPPDDIGRLRALFPRARIIKTYGQTETFRTLAEARFDRILLHSCGESIPGVEAVVVDENLNICGPGESGQMIHFGDGAMSGYWLDGELTQAKMIPRSKIGGEKSDSLGVLTGDFFQVLANGGYRFEGRRDHMVKRMGNRFYLSEIDDGLRKSGLVKEACTVLISSDDRWQPERLVAFVQVEENSEEITRELMRYCVKQFSSYKVPDQFRALTQFPRTASNKIDRMKLVAMASERT
jgi:acyl-coenzyme A synthetase/AMP-(fatty) acid ligase